MAKPFKVVRERLLIIACVVDGPTPRSTAANAGPTGNLASNPVKRWIDGRGRPLNLQRRNSWRASQNDWRPGSRG
jgi:hypothetical protein